MNIYLPSSLRNLWEGSWVKFLLGDHYHNSRYYDSEIPLVNNSLIITTHNTSYKQHVELLILNKFNFGVFLLSDEFLTDNCEFVDDPLCKFLIRNYIFPSLYQNPKVLHIGLGYKRNFDKYALNNEYVEREITWNFIGSVHGESRRKAINSFNQLEGGFLHTTQHFNSSDYLSTEKYCSILSNSCYTLCPQGHANNETFRIFESLEAGSVPVVLNNSESHPFNPGYWHYLFPGEPSFPFIVAENWDEAFLLVKNDLREGRTHTRLKQCQLFWNKWKSSWKYQFQMKLCSLLH
jgi:hypothetical protein